MDQPPEDAKQSEQPAAPAADAQKPDDTAKAAADDVNALEAEPPEGTDKPLSNLSDVADVSNTTDKQKPTKKLKAPKMNIYIIVFIALFVIGGGIVGYSLMTSSKKPPVATINNQALSQAALNQLANSDASIGGSAQTLTVQSNAVFNDQILAKGNLTAAGNLQTGGSITTPNLIVSNTANLGTVQAKTLQVANGSTFQGNSSFATISVASSSSFSGVITASQINVTKLVLSGSGGLVIPNHISFPIASPVRSANETALGSGGSSSVSGSDTSGEVHISTGNNPSGGCFIQVTFSQAFPTAPHIIISPIGSASAAQQYYATTTSTSFSVCANNPSPGTVYIYDYLVMG